MINVVSNARQVAGNLIRLEGMIGATIDESVEEALDRLIEQLRTRTPVVTGRMKAGYEIQKVDALEWYLEDEAYYAAYVVDGTRHNRSNPALAAILNDGVDDMEKELDLAITQLSFRF